MPPTTEPISTPPNTNFSSNTDLKPKLVPSKRNHKPPAPSPKWYHQVTLDFLISILNQTLFNPAMILLFYLCLAAVHKHRTWVAYWTVYFYTGQVVWGILSWVNRRITYGGSRKVEWKDEVVVVTGGARGLGRVLVELLVRGKGCRVAVLDLEAEDRELRELVEERVDDGGMGVDVGVNGDGDGDGDGVQRREGLWWGVCDVGDFEQVKNMAERIEKELGRPTILINNAAIPVHGLPLVPLNNEAISSLTPKQAAKTLQVNTLAHFNTLSAFMPYLTSNANGGTIVTISSILALLSPSLLSDYCAAKAAISSLHQTLTHEISRHPSSEIRKEIKTVLVEPGQMDTALFSDLTNLPWYAHFFGPVLPAKDVAKEIVNQLDRGQSGVLRMPFYAKFMPVYGALPGAAQLLVRLFSGIDSAIGRNTSSKKRD